MKRLIQFGVILMALVMVLAGCQNKPGGEDKKSSSDSSSSSNSKDKLVLYTAGPDDLVKDMVKEYEKESGKK